MRTVQQSLKDLIQMFVTTEATVKGEDLKEGEEPTVVNMQEFGRRMWTRLIKEGDLLDGLLENLPVALAEVMHRMDELTEMMVHGSLVRINGEEQDLVDFDSLEIEDIANLRLAVTEQTDWRKLWETEKNSWVDVVSRIMPVQSSGTNPVSSPDGGPAGSLSSLPEVLNSATS